jgi:hypothetical protein
MTRGIMSLMNQSAPIFAAPKGQLVSIVTDTLFLRGRHCRACARISASTDFATAPGFPTIRGEVCALHNQNFAFQVSLEKPLINRADSPPTAPDRRGWGLRLGWALSGAFEGCGSGRAAWNAFNPTAPNMNTLKLTMGERIRRRTSEERVLPPSSSWGRLR